MSRGNAKQTIFLDAADYERFLELLEATSIRADVAVAIEPHRAVRDVSRRERYAVRRRLECIFADCHDAASRRRLMIEAYWRHGYTLREIAALVGCHESTVGKHVRRAESVASFDPVVADGERP